jgi:phage terminase large subunit GpA-like protein
VAAIKSAERSTTQRASTKGAPLFIVGVDGIMARIIQRIGDKAALRFSASLDPVWFEQFASERRLLKYHHGRPVHVWERIRGRRAEALDCVVYAFAAFGLVSGDPLRRENGLREIPGSSAAVPTVIRSAWMERGR